MFVTTRAKVIVDSTGAASEIVIVITPNGVLLPLIDYFRFYAASKSLSWQKKVAQSVILFMDYLVANPRERNRQILFQNFALRLATGTFNQHTKLDPSRLCWAPRSPVVRTRTVHLLTDFFKYIKRDRPQAEQLNPEYEKTPFDELIDQAAYSYRREAAMLGYSWTTGVEDKAPSVRSRAQPKVAPQTPPAFPENRFEELLVKGFLEGRSRDYRGACITLLMHGAGFRESEPFHLYIQDVFPTPGDSSSCSVQIHHPAYGEAPLDWTLNQGRPPNACREEYLLRCFGLRPRNQITGKLHSGWKNPLLNANYYMRAYWFQTHYGRWFKELWDGYILQLVSVHRSHPWAWVNLTRDPVGEPYKLAQFNKAHAIACERIGLTVAKNLGTTPHGHRHAYGQRLKLAEIDAAHIKIFMHHKSLEAQTAYTTPSHAELAKAIAEGMDKITNKNPHPDA